MEAFCKAGDSSIAFCKVGDAEKAENVVRGATGDDIQRVWEVGDGEEAGKQSITEAVGDAEAGYGKLQQFCEAEEELPCENTPVYAVFDDFHEVGDVESDNWVSPRISFSQDFVMADIYSLSQNSRGSSDRKNGEHDIKDNYSAEFAFLKDGPPQHAPDQAKGLMLSADELFFDGKLLPLPFPSIWAASYDLGLSSLSEKHGQEPTQNSRNRPMSRHLSFDIPKPLSTASSSFAAHSTCASGSASPCKSSHVGTSLGYLTACTHFPLFSPSSVSIPTRPLPTPPLPPPSSSSSSTSLPPTSPPPTPSLPSLSSMSSSIVSTPSTASLPSCSSVTKCSTKFKDFFKSKKSSKDASPPSQLTRDNSITSTCTPPLSSRSFWPFSRSNSAGVSKSTATPPLPCRSNSAGESHTCNAPSPKQLGPILANQGENAHSTKPTAPLEAAREEENSIVCSNSNSNGAATYVDTAESRTMSENAKRLDLPSSSKVSGKKLMGAPGRGNPGKRKGVSSGSAGKANAGKIVLRNLERCSAERKIGKDGARGLSRRGSFPVGARVSPVLNVAVYRGPSTPKIGFFRFNPLLFSKKEKPAADQAAINWRNGA